MQFMDHLVAKFLLLSYDSKIRDMQVELYSATIEKTNDV